MGKATRWFKGLFSFNKEKEQTDFPNYGDRKDDSGRNLGNFGRNPEGLIRNPATIPPNITTAEAAWLRSSFFNNQIENEESMHAIAVAAATAAAADAAVAAAQAAAIVVRLTNRGRGSGAREKVAAVKIQTFFRGYLSRKALRALKGLVKLQAIVRGFLVRKQATATFHSMQVLIRVQATIRAQKAYGLVKNDIDKFESLLGTRKSIERFDETGSDHSASLHSMRLSTSFDHNSNSNNAIDESAKIVEVDTGRPKSRNRRANTWVSDSSEDQALSSPLPRRGPARLLIPVCRNFRDYDWGPAGDESRFSTAQSTPRCANSGGSYTSVTPATSVCLDGFFRPCMNSPSYMANTQSFKAKLRSHSAPKQRPDAGPKKKLSLDEMMEARSSLSGVKLQKPCSQAQEVVSFKNAVMCKFDRPSNFVTTPQEKNCYM